MVLWNGSEGVSDGFIDVPRRAQVVSRDDRVEEFCGRRVGIGFFGTFAPHFSGISTCVPKSQKVRNRLLTTFIREPQTSFIREVIERGF